MSQREPFSWARDRAEGGKGPVDLGDKDTLKGGFGRTPHTCPTNLAPPLPDPGALQAVQSGHARRCGLR